MNDRITPDNITELKDNEVFVFGSNLAGIHGAGAAKLARMKFGAKLYKGEGRYGRTYAIPTKDETINTLPKFEISIVVNRFINYATKCPDDVFLVTEIGCGLAGYTPEDIAPMFMRAKDIKNIHLPQRFWNIINKL